MLESKINILIVDDKPEKVLALEAVLEALGQNIVRAYSGREALRCLLGCEVAVILLDVNMPGMDGFETASLIRQRPSTHAVPIIFVTAMDDQTHESQGYSLGAVDYIQTPIVPEVLRAKVAVFVNLFRKNEQVRHQADSLRLRAAQLHKLTAASLAIHSATTLEHMLSVITETAREVTAAELSRAILFTGENSQRTMMVASNSTVTESHQLEGYRPDQLGLHATVRRTGKPLRMSPDEMQAHPMWRELNGQSALTGTAGGWLAVPLTAREGGNLGLIEVTKGGGASFTGDDEALLVQLAQMGSIAVENTLYAAERETNRIKDEFLSTLSHELRTPLNAILGWTQLLKSEPLPGDVGHGLDVIDRNARAQTKLIDDLLDVSRITTGKLRVTLRTVALAPIVRAAVDSIRPSVEAKHIALEVNIDAREDTMLEADPDRLQQVFWNLFVNAVKFTPAKGRIGVQLEADGQTARFSVSDSGCGISRAFLPQVFDRFRQADSTSTRSHGGLGIGLTIVRHIVKLHGGNVEADSAGEGKGATFMVTLPLLDQNAAALRLKDQSNTASPRSSSEPIDLSGLRVLMVDDERDAREVLATTLSRHGAQVRSAASVDEAIAEFAKDQPDLVISDIAMPDKDGFDLIGQIRALPRHSGGNVPAFAVSAYARNVDRTRALAAGFQLHLPKPIDPDTLIRAAAQVKAAHAGVI